MNAGILLDRPDLLHDRVQRVRHRLMHQSGLMAFDRTVVDGVVMGQAATTAGFSLQLRRIQNGFVRSYALSVLGGAAVVVLAMLVVNL